MVILFSRFVIYFVTKKEIEPLTESLWNQKRFFYGIAVKNLLSTFIFKSVITYFT